MRQCDTDGGRDIKIGARVSEKFRDDLKVYATRNKTTMEKLIIAALKAYIRKGGATS